MTKRFHESTGASAKSLGNGVFEAKVIQPGWNKSGTRYYSEALLKDFGPATFREGRPCFANHPTQAEFENGRDVTKIWGRLIADSEYREDGADGPGLYAPVKVRNEYIEFVDEYKDSIGMSIFASGEGVKGEAEGKEGLLVETFDSEDPYTSVDFVVAAGAGGKVQHMLESFVPVTEALANTRRQELSNLVQAAHGAKDSFVWVRDYDTENGVVYFDVETDEGYTVFSQGFTVANDVAVELEGEREEVRAVTQYVPVNAIDTKENAMTPDEKAEFAAMIATAVKEALAPAPTADENEKVTTPAEVAEAVVAANLPAPARARVFEALTKDPAADVAAVIEAEKTYAEALRTEVTEVEDGTPGYVRESAIGKPTTYTSPWGN